MNKRLYNAPNRLVLIISETEYVIREPLGFKDAEFSIERNDHHGFDYKFPASDLSLKFHNKKTTGTSYSKAKELIDNEIDTKGADAEIKMRVDYLTDGDWVELETIELDTEAEKTGTNENAVTVLKTSDDTEEKRIKDLLDTKVNLYIDKDYDGNSITSAETTDVYYHSKALLLRFEDVTGLGYSTRYFFDNVIGASAFTLNVPLMFPTIVLNEMEDEYQGITLDDAWTGALQLDKAQFDLKYDGEFSINLVDQKPAVTGLFDISANFNYVYSVLFKIYDIDGDEVYSDTIDTTSGSLSSGAFAYSPNFDFEYSYEASRGDRIFFYIKIDVSSDENVFSIASSTGGNQSAIIEHESLIDGGYLNSYNLMPTLQKVTEVLTGVNSLSSDFLTNTYPNFYLTSGSILKGGDLDTTTAPVLSLEKSLQSVDAIFNTGWNFEEVEGTKTIVLEESAHFYNQENQIIDLTDKDIWSVSERVATEYIYNEAEFKYPDLRYDELNTVDEFNTNSEYLLASRKIKNKYSKISDWKTQGYDIEFLRRQALKTDSTAFKEDKDIYLVACNPNQIETFAGFNDLLDYIAISLNNYNKIKASLELNPEFTISGSTSNNKTFTLSSVTQIGTGVRLMVDESVIDEDDKDITISVSDITTEADEHFSFLDNVISPSTVYNAKLTPARNMLRHSVWLNASMHYKESTDSIRNTEYELNGQMLNRLSESDDYYDPNRNFLRQNQDIALAGLNQFNHWVIPVISSFTVELSFTEFLTIKDACKGGVNKYGYITHKNFKGQTIDSWILSVKGKPTDNKFTFETLWWRVNGEGPPPIPDYWTDETLDNILTEDGGEVIPWT